MIAILDYGPTLKKPHIKFGFNRVYLYTYTAMSTLYKTDENFSLIQNKMIKIKINHTITMTSCTCYGQNVSLSINGLIILQGKFNDVKSITSKIPAN